MKTFAKSILILGFCAPLTLTAEPIFESAPPSPTNQNGFFITNDASGAASFTLDDYASLESVDFFAYEPEDSTWLGTPTLNYAIWRDDGSEPSQDLAVANATSDVTVFEKVFEGSFTADNNLTYNQYKYSFELQSAVGLSADTLYWLEIYLGQTVDLNVDPADWLWAQTSTVAPGSIALPYFNVGPSDPPDWVGAGGTGTRSAAFTLYGSVPVPSTLVLFAPLALIFARRRRSAAATKSLLP